jgi:autotransporter translocation and assembly factor TamB
VESASITATIRGRISHPELKLTSDATSSERDIFAMLVTGSSNLSDVDTAGVVAHAASALTSLSNSAAQQERAERLGLDSIRLSYGESLSEPIVTFGKNISKDVYAETTLHQNADLSENAIEGLLRYRMTPQWALEFYYGDRAIGGLGLWWLKSFERWRDLKLKNLKAAKKEQPRRRDSAPPPTDAPSKADSVSETPDDGSSPPP